MDHISKALERAKSERKSVRDWVVKPDSSQQPTQGLADDPQSVQHGIPVALDLDLLKANHVLCGPSADAPEITDRYRLLRTRVLQLMKPQGWTKLGITSPGPRAGKTLNTLNLATSIARDGNFQVVVVDADLRQPAVAQTLGIEPECGLIDYLSGRASLDEVVLAPSGFDNLSIIPGRHSESDAEAPEYLRSRRMSQLVQSLKANGSSSMVVLVDLPPVFIGDDVIAVAPLLDCMLLVIDEGSTTKEEIAGTAELLKDFNLLGTVLNRSSEHHKEAIGYYQSYHG